MHTVIKKKYRLYIEMTVVYDPLKSRGQKSQYNTDGAMIACLKTCAKLLGTDTNVLRLF